MHAPVGVAASVVDAKDRILELTRRQDAHGHRTARLELEVIREGVGDGRGQEFGGIVNRHRHVPDAKRRVLQLGAQAVDLGLRRGQLALRDGQLVLEILGPAGQRLILAAERTDRGLIVAVVEVEQPDSGGADEQGGGQGGGPQAPPARYTRGRPRIERAVARSRRRLVRLGRSCIDLVSGGGSCLHFG